MSLLYGTSCAQGVCDVCVRGVCEVCARCVRGVFQVCALCAAYLRSAVHADFRENTDG